MNTPNPIPVAIHSTEQADRHARSASVSNADQQAFDAATVRLRHALHAAANGAYFHEVCDARLALRSLAVKLRDAGFWRSDKQGLRATVSLLWEADRFVNDHALTCPDDKSAQL
ncbi:hypothetical protein [Blastomonas aquatica]|uniref:Uncharacterized protein n=1 Tax=Blastomonas aquatica TaxID=1510276 RepID=A0ABQ1JBJ6_9SPHN|nr:hypothetical protein [Blastomonas aquatica]GGB64460.1 hypothetical protein GCM10010833_19480 [Blastomonas aquatica]